MKTFLTLSWLLLALSAQRAVHAELSSGEIRCTLERGGKVSEKFLIIETATDGLSRTQILADQIGVNGQATRYRFAFHPDASQIEFSAGNAQLESSLLPGEHVGWEVFDAFGGVAEKVSCTRGGSSDPTPAKRVACRLKQVRAETLGAEPIVIEYPERAGSPSEMSSSLRFDNAEAFEESIYSTDFDGVTASVLLGAYSDHVLDLFQAPLSAGRRLAIRAGDRGSYEDFVCQAE